MRKLFVFLFMLSFATPAFAITEKPPELNAYIKHATAPYGEATLTKLMFKPYEASLWTDAPTWSMDKTFALSLVYGMHFTTTELSDRSIDEMEGIYGKQPEYEHYRDRLHSLFHDVKKGDRITALYLPKEGAVRLFYNGTQTGSISDPVFAQRFIGIWMSPKTSEPQMRAKLLSKNGG